MTKKCICFQRVSSYRQDTEPQRIAVHNAALKDYKESEILEVTGKESAIKLTEEERVTLQEMKELVNENPTVECIYFFSVDRLARRVSVVMSIKEWADSKKINLVFLNPYPFSTWFKTTDGTLKKNEISDIYLMFLSFGAKMEMEIKAERFAAAKNWLRKNNKVTGKLLYGYKADPVTKDIIVDTEKASIIKWCFDCYINKNMQTSQIFEEGVEFGYWPHLEERTSRSNKIRVYLKNYAYAGVQQPGGVIYPPIVDKEEVDKAIEIMSRKASKPIKTLMKNIYYCKSLLRDEDTDNCLIVDRNHVRYKLTNSKKCYGINLNICDSVLWMTAYETKWNLTNYSEDDQLKDTIKQIEDVEIKISTLKKYIDDDLTPKFTKAYDAYINSRGRITIDLYNSTISKLEKEQKSVENKITYLVKRKTELLSVQSMLEQKERRNVDLLTIRDIKDDKLRLEIIKECITKMTIKKLDSRVYVIKVYSITEEEPHNYVHIHYGPNKFRTYWMLNTIYYETFNVDEELKKGSMIDVTKEIEIRYKREYR
jgi:DNA invertase Pin-like site-specific DNA recombinase